jgi:hypothetical protein
MKNKEKILIALASFSFFLIVYLIIASEPIEMSENTITVKEEKIEKVDLALLESNYRENVKNIYIKLQEDVYSWLNLSDASLDPINEISRIKNDLMSLVVPEEYRSFHVGLIVLIDKIINNNFVLDDDFQAELNKIGLENVWLK